jgi:hypothetical protein
MSVCSPIGEQVGEVYRGMCISTFLENKLGGVFYVFNKDIKQHIGKRA